MNRLNLFVVILVVGICQLAIPWRANALNDPVVRGTYRAIVIGNNAYKDPEGVWLPLKTAVNDAKSVAAVLESSYGFSDINLLLDASRGEILGAFSDIIKRLKSDDNVLIYYAGHGHLNENTDEAFWIPVDAQGMKDYSFISNVRIKEKLTVIAAKAAHAILVSDSCFSGSLLRGGSRGSSENQTTEPYLRKLFNRKSVQIVAAGGLQFVDDNYQSSGHSPFTYFFLQELKNYSNKYLIANSLFSELTRLVANNVFQTPTSGILHGAGDEGGQFIFSNALVNNEVSKPKPVEQIKYIQPSKDTRATTISADTAAAMQISYWESIKDKNNPSYFNDFIKKFPNSQFRDIALMRRDELVMETQKPKKLKIAVNSKKYRVSDEAGNSTVKAKTGQSNYNEKPETVSNGTSKIVIKAKSKPVNIESVNPKTQSQIDNEVLAVLSKRPAPKLESEQKFISEPSLEPDMKTIKQRKQLARKQSRMSINQLLEIATDHFDAGRIIDPPNYNARDTWRKVLKMSPKNYHANRGLSKIAKLLVTKANSLIDQRDFAAANKLLIQAKKTQPRLKDIKRSRKHYNKMIRR